MAVVRLRVAGLTLAVRSDQETRALDLPSALRPFACARGGDIQLTLRREPVPAPPPGPALFDSGGIWRVHGFEGGLLYSFRTPRLDPSIYKGVAIDAGLRRGTLYFPHARPRSTRAVGDGRRGSGAGPRLALDYPLDELLFQHRLARDGAFELHACGLVRAGRAVLFAGRSGAGKSTTARLWRRHRRATRVLSDDRIVVRERRSRPWAWGTPWHGDGGFASPDGRPLAAVFFLRHARRTRVRRLPIAGAAAQLFARSFPPVWDAASVARVLDACARVASSVPCYELAFRPDVSAIEAVEQALR